MTAAPDRAEERALTHRALRVRIDGKTGAFREIVHGASGISLIARPELAAQNPFMIVLEDGTLLREWRSCTVQSASEDPRSIQLRWILEDDLVLEALLSQDAGSGDVRCTVSLLNPRNLAVAALAYPYLTGIERLGPTHDADELVHSYATGFLIRNPLDTLPPVESEVRGREPIALGLYPEGFSGSTMQFMAYSAAGLGGFYLATEDGVGFAKWLNFYRHTDGDLRMAIWHAPLDHTARRRIAPPYSTVLAALPEGTWYDAAERYRDWAAQQRWLSRGPLWAREDRCRWLLEQVGLCAFGINPRRDRRQWIEAIGAVAGTPVLHILGPDWPRSGADYLDHLPGGLADWFPATFDPATLDAIRRHGDYLVPFEFDLLFGRGDDRADRLEATAALQEFPALPLSRDHYARFPYLCPATTYLKTLHRARDRQLVLDWPVDGVYYDISLNNVRHTCISVTHEHLPGASTAITDAYQALLSESAAAMQCSSGNRTIPQGSELINEQSVSHLAFYQARGEACPAAPFEADLFRTMIKEGSAEKIPLFAFVYHEFGPVRLDGWAKLSREQGDFVYFALGRVFVQGGLIELNYEFSALEDLGGIRDQPAEHYYPFAEHYYAIEPALARFVGALARARVGRANRYLAYGAMLRPAPYVIAGDTEVALQYYLYHVGTDFPEYGERGSMRVPAVLQSAWRYRDQGVAWMLLNVGSEDRWIELHLKLPALVEQSPLTWHLTLYRDENTEEPLGPLTTARTITVLLPARLPVLIEAVPIYTSVAEASPA